MVRPGDSSAALCKWTCVLSWTALVASVIAIGSMLLAHFGMADAAVAMIAAAALCVSIWQCRATSRHARMSVRPRLDFRWEETADRFSLQLCNSGLGPAIVTRLQVAVGTSPLAEASPTEWDNVAATFGFGSVQRRAVQTATTIAPSLCLPILTGVIQSGERKGVRGLTVRAAYESLFSEVYEESIYLLQQVNGHVELAPGVRQ